MGLTQLQTTWVREGFEEEILNWCHPWGDEPVSYIGCTQEEYDARAEQYYHEVIDDPALLEKDWGVVFNNMKIWFKEEFNATLSSHDYIPIFNQCLMDQLIMN